MISGGRPWEAKAAMTTGAAPTWIGAACLGLSAGEETPPVSIPEAAK